MAITLRNRLVLNSLDKTFLIKMEWYMKISYYHDKELWCVGGYYFLRDRWYKCNLQRPDLPLQLCLYKYLSTVGGNLISITQFPLPVCLLHDFVPLDFYDVSKILKINAS